MSRKQKLTLCALGAPVALSGATSMSITFYEAGFAGIALAIAAAPCVVAYAVWKAIGKSKEAPHA